MWVKLLNFWMFFILLIVLQKMDCNRFFLNLHLKTFFFSVTNCRYSHLIFKSIAYEEAKKIGRLNKKDDYYHKSLKQT